MPHPLPEDVSGVSGTRWFLVAVPDDAAFIQAAYAIYTELTHYWKWGLEGPVPVESDAAAQLWASAVDETLEALEMGFPDVLLSHIDDVESLLRDLLLASCCANTSVTGETVESDIVPDVGDPPSTWGDGEPVADWVEWRQLVCGAADTWVDHLIGQVSLIETYLDLGLFTIGVAVAILSAGAGAGILISIAYGTAVEMFSAILANVNDLVFVDIEAGLQNQRAEIRCAIFEGCDELKAEIQVAVGAIAWTAWYQWYDWCSIRNSLLEGTFNGGFHAVSPSSLCDSCDVSAAFIHHTDQADLSTSTDGYDADGSTVRTQNYCSDASLWVLACGTNGRWRINAKDAAVEEGYVYPAGTTETYIRRVEGTLCHLDGGAMRVEIISPALTIVDSVLISSVGAFQWDPTTAGPVNATAGNGYTIRFMGNGTNWGLSEIKVYYDVVVI